LGWAAIRYQSTIRFADVTGDAKADLCARAAAGVLCWPFDGAAFASTPLPGPVWSDESGWDGTAYYESIRMTAPRARCRLTEECNGVDDTCDGDIDEGCVSTDPDDTHDERGPDASPTGDAGLAQYQGGSGCTCRASGAPASIAAPGALLALALLARRSRRRG
jgi:MYXO-CTERM domain-containing protein